MTRQRQTRDTPYRDWCVGEADTCATEIDFSKGSPGKDGLCTKHDRYKATPDPQRGRRR
ncbi:MAG TPA: hypothetical protein VIU11_14350 [Nakamurella sp.]